MPALYRDHGEPLRRLFTRAHGLGLATSLDMTAIDPASEAARVDWPAFLRNVLPAVDCFLPSAEELCAMLAPTQHAQWLERANGRDVTACLDIATDVSPLAEEILALGAKIAVVKCGARGLLYRIAEKSALATMPFPLDIAAWASRSGFQPAFRLERVVSATGAGDVSIAAFLASLLSGLPPEACARRAAASGACCVEVCDALSGVPSFAQLDRRIAQGWTTVSTAAE
jgi:sugar/nucleoside kinase (ribokinase family)